MRHTAIELRCSVQEVETLSMNVHIVGMGLAGSCLMWELLRRGVNVAFVDDADPSSASNVAAGLINPITGIPPKENWNGVEILDVALRTYREIETHLGVKILRECTINRVFESPSDQAAWNAASTRGLQTKWTPTESGVEYTGAIVDTVALIAAIKSHAASTLLPLLPNTVTAVSASLPTLPRTVTADSADINVWCEGWRASHNELWSWLPFQPVKGEILDAEIHAPYLTSVLVGKCGIVPVKMTDDGMQIVRIGSTYDWDDLTPTPTDAARELLKERAERILGRTITVVKHQAAVRPSAQSKRPYIGRHPEQHQHAILNGFGAKGALWAPWAAQQLADHLIHDAALHPEVDIKRWWKK